MNRARYSIQESRLPLLIEEGFHQDNQKMPRIIREIKIIIIIIMSTINNKEDMFYTIKK